MFDVICQADHNCGNTLYVSTLVYVLGSDMNMEIVIAYTLHTNTIAKRTDTDVIDKRHPTMAVHLDD